MKPSKIIDHALNILGEPYKSKEAKRILLAIGYQESGFETRKQYPVAYAKGFWQFEQGGGVIGVITHPRSETAAAMQCRAFGLPDRPKEVHDALAHCQFDLFAAVFARLLMWTDLYTLPEDEQLAWEFYIRVWRPGKPHRDRWNESWEYAKCEMK